jgi:hypothetical protein
VVAAVVVQLIKLREMLNLVAVVVGVIMVLVVRGILVEVQYLVRVQAVVVGALTLRILPVQAA